MHRTLADDVDYAFVDGTFASADEIPGRAIADIPHPLMPVTNRQLDAPDVVKDGARFVM